MPNTIDKGFRIFHSRLTPTETEVESAMSHRQSIEDCLSSNYRLDRLFRTGSFGNGTSIRGLSDTDYFATINPDDLSNNSSYTLKNLRDVLANRYYSTAVSVRTPGVVIPFGQGGCETTEVIPAYEKTTRTGWLIYGIPDFGGGWMESCPDAHNEYVREINDRLGRKLKPLIRFVKAWAYYNEVPIKSFYLEMRAAKYASEEKVIVYSLDLKRIFEQLNNCGLASIRDPTGTTGMIDACKTDAMLQTSLSKLNTATTRAEKAWTFESQGDIKNAYSYWDLLFNRYFPAY